MTDEPHRGKSSRDAELEALRQKSLVGTQRESLKTAQSPEMTLEKWQLQQRNFTEEERRKRSDASAYLHSYREKNVPTGTNKTPARRTDFPPGPDEQAQIGSSTDIKGIVAEFEKSIHVTTPTAEPMNNNGNPLAEKIAPQDNSLPCVSDSQPEKFMVDNNLKSTNAAIQLTEETSQTDFSKALQAEEVTTTEEYPMTTAQLVDDNIYQEDESEPQPDSIPVVDKEPDVNAELTQTYTQEELEPVSTEAEPQSNPQLEAIRSPVETEGLLSVEETDPQYDVPQPSITSSPVKTTEWLLEPQVDPQPDATNSPVTTTEWYSPVEPQLDLQPEAASSPLKTSEWQLPVEPQIQACAPILELPRKQVDVKVLLAVHVKQTDADAILVGGQRSILDSVIWVTENIVKDTIATSACLDATGTIYDSNFPPTITSVEADNAGTPSESITRLIVRIIVTLFQLSDARKRDRKEVINEVAHALREAVAGGSFAQEAKALRRAQKEV